MAGENINHCNGVRLRVIGSGNLKFRLLGLSEAKTQTMTSLAMSSSTYIEPIRLANFKAQRFALELKTTEIDEIFNIQRIVMFVKATETMYPG